jgi:hypothetical protein
LSSVRPPTPYKLGKNVSKTALGRIILGGK